MPKGATTKDHFVVDPSGSAPKGATTKDLLVTLLAGLFQLGAGLLRLGNLTQFISRSVLVGFIAGAGLLIAVSQLPNLFGLSGHSSVSIVEGVEHVFARFKLNGSTAMMPERDDGRQPCPATTITSSKILSRRHPAQYY